jgi:hypothetical protein
MIILVCSYWKIIIPNYLFSVYYWICNFIQENNEAVSCFCAGPWIVLVMNIVWYGSEYAQSKRAVFLMGTYYSFQGREGWEVGVFKDMSELS